MFLIEIPAAKISKAERQAKRIVAEVSEEIISALKSTDLWIIPGDNSTGFTAYPAGLYNPNTGRFENLLGETRFWTSENVGGALATSAGATFSCNAIIFQNNSKDSGFSIRCVKN